MKLVKMSLAAAVLVGASAFAVDNVKVSGNAELIYSTQDAGTATLFDKAASAADAALNLNISADLAKNSVVTVSAGAGYTVISTLGLENNLVRNVVGSSHGATTSTHANYLGAAPFNGVKVENASWMNEAWVALSANTLTKSTVKVGRMELDTPLAFTEKWSIEKNTFEAAVLINQDLPDTTIVAAYIGNGNGTETFGQNVNGAVIKNSLAVAPLVNQNGQFTTYGENGAYAAGIINNSFKPLTAQAWYYDVSKFAQAYWLQADLDASSLGLTGLTAGAQYTAITIEKGDHYLGGSTATATTLASDVNSNAYAVMLGYSMKDMFAAKVSYSEVDKEYSAAFNTATAAGTAQTKLYTEAWWNYGQVTKAGAKAMNLTVTSPVAGLFDAGLYVTSVDQINTATAKGQDLTEVTVTAGKKFGPLDATLAYISTDYNNGGTDSNTVQAYLTLNF